MPQISPMNWMLIITTLYLTMLVLKENQIAIFSQKSNPKKASKKPKSLSW